jgi:hypothetical protein
MLNNKPTRWISKRQRTLGTSNYGSESMSSRITTERILEVMFIIELLGMALDGPALKFDDRARS